MFRKLFPIPKIQDMLLKVECFKHALSLDISIGYYHIDLSPGEKQLYTIVLLRGKWEYQKLYMGFITAPKFYRRRYMIYLGGGLYGILIYRQCTSYNQNDFKDHLNSLEKVFQKLSEVVLKVSTEKSFFRHIETNYLGFLFSMYTIRPLTYKVEVSKAIFEPKQLYDLRRFVGIINYYRYMWCERAHMLDSLTKL